jgi:uncharacterized membrane protein YozB (DUF420 family)
MNLPFQPTLNALLNSLATVLLIAGYIQIRRGHREAHRRLMVAAFTVSTAFLVSYVLYHARIGHTAYPYHDWTRPLYFGILVPHVLLAGLVAPFILALLFLAWRQRFETHRRLARWVWPVWLFVSLSGVAIYAMLYLRGA